MHFNYFIFYLICYHDLQICFKFYIVDVSKNYLGFSDLGFIFLDVLVCLYLNVCYFVMSEFFVVYFHTINILTCRWKRVVSETQCLVFL